ncbi:hypothetical protein RFI_06051 [Reticulomyxa filosa]|uniref:Uncharacterized protein n=1 Tax=Reticulomyxa filosa TaxID=46433 RepID=X6NZ02_RETFI|nr:hypothetical protein RFI_06051 [Reticulomyxa filosa]|eukprot:ETO31069.1 hypothetical protein RFI_06051 [Reticulomyxa filosa]
MLFKNFNKLFTIFCFNHNKKFIAVMWKMINFFLCSCCFDSIFLKYKMSRPQYEPPVQTNQAGETKTTELVTGEEGRAETQKEVLLEVRANTLFFFSACWIKKSIHNGQIDKNLQLHTAVSRIVVWNGPGLHDLGFCEKRFGVLDVCSGRIGCARILEVKKFPQKFCTELSYVQHNYKCLYFFFGHAFNELKKKYVCFSVVRIWSSKNVEEMLHPPVNWKEAVGDGDFYIQSDMYDMDKNYVRTTAVYHDRKTCALTVRERFVSRARGLSKLTMTSPYAAAFILLISLIFAVAKYLFTSNAGPNISVFLMCVLVLVPALLLVGCIIEIELRKRVTKFFFFFF